MASSATNLDTPITVKILFDGSTRRWKAPLKDLGINVFESKLRSVLAIPDGTETILERYSDSASAYVTLDRNNTAVYKQLGRAAKAKHKLKIRVTIKEPVVEEKMIPKPASVEDDVEDAAAPQALEVAETETEIETPPVASSTPTTAPQLAPTEVQKAFALMESTHETIQATIAATISQSQSLICPQRVQTTASTPSPPPLPFPRVVRTNFAVCCNSCDRNIPEVHYHCSTCDDGDFDLCQECVDQGKSCHGEDHWLIKRFIKHGIITNSTTERLAPKMKKPSPATEPKAAAAPPAPLMVPERIIPIFNEYLYSSIRTCNCCVQELPEVEFVHCTTCDDYDLCRPCFAKNRHGHHPAHGFAPAVEGTRLENEVSSRLEPGRDHPHNAICDGCDKNIKGIRHKCLDCPDWDYCSACVINSTFIHPGHRFVPVYEALELASAVRIRAFSRPTHIGICCDGPLCQSARSASTYIVGDRYKCAVCDDTDFCANCEASPANTHNKTHPLIKFKTPVRSVSVTTTGEHENGRQMPPMGDRTRPRSSLTSSRATETAPQNVLLTGVQTVADLEPSEPSALVKVEKEADVEGVEKPMNTATAPAAEDLVAVFVRDTVADGTVFGPDHVFEQTWILRNDGKVAWPAGCSVKYVGGDYMGHVDSSHPAATQDLESSSESTICYSSIAPGEEFPFTVLLRTPQRSGRIVSNWRLTTKDNIKFGHRLWCDVVVEKQRSTVPFGAQETVPKQEPEAVPTEVHQSQMIFPKLDKESAVPSITQDARSEVASSKEDEYEDCAEDDDWAEDESDGFMTDEEYDILDASDEEYQQGQQLKK